MRFPLLKRKADHQKILFWIHWAFQECLESGEHLISYIGNLRNVKSFKTRVISPWYSFVFVSNYYVY